MAPLLIKNMDTIKDACIKHKVKSLYVFGSAVTENFSKDSDIDFLYIFKKDEIPFDHYADNFFDLLFFLEDTLKRKIDLVPEEKLKNPYFISKVNSEKIKIYGS